MRYLNWDVLIFSEAGDSTAPLQEFRTSCGVVQNPRECIAPFEPQPRTVTLSDRAQLQGR